MDDRRFDGLTKAFASSGSRRSLIKGLLGSSGAAIAALGLSGRSTLAARRSRPTPEPVQCPGQQIWDGSECVCPSGVACGPDCCDTPEQCCDNACCDSGSVCVAEEQCCPVEQVCPNYPGGPCCPDGLLCCASGDACFDSAGGCCETNDCPTEYCNPVTCENNVCVYQPLQNGTDCGDCATCQNGHCTSKCADGETCCTDDDTCVDLKNNGCCGDSNCSADPAPCPGVCTDHQCQPSASVSCPTPDGTVCCPEGDDCYILGTNNGQPVGVCCGSEAAACLTPTDLVCCADGAQCAYFATIGDTPVGMCCAAGTDACRVPNADNPFIPAGVCCDAGTQCYYEGNYPYGACCATEASACLTASGTQCCAGDTVCTPYSGSDAETRPSLCCDSGLEACYLGASLVCCPSGSACQPLTFQGITFDICCPSDESPCWTSNGGGVCCKSGQTCEFGSGCADSA